MAIDPPSASNDMQSFESTCKEAPDISFDDNTDRAHRGHTLGPEGSQTAPDMDMTAAFQRRLNVSSWRPSLRVSRGQKERLGVHNEDQVVEGGSGER